MNGGCGNPDCPACAARAQEQTKARAVLARIDQARSDRAAGLARWRSAPGAVHWFVGEYLRRSSARGLPMDRELGGGGAGDTSARDRQFAAVVGAITVAEKDDAERYPSRRAPIRTWLMQHFAPAQGRSYAQISEAFERAGWTEIEVSRRVERALRIIRDRLRAGGWLEAPGDP